MTVDVAQIRAVKESDLELVRAWRNHPDVQKYMYTRHNISKKEHEKWFRRCQQDSNRHLMLVERKIESRGVEPFGFVHLHVVDSVGKRTVWGFYLSPTAPRGSGQVLGRATIDYVFSTLRQHKLWGEALANNEHSIRFHQRLGFIEEARLRDHYFDGRNYHDVIGLGLLNNEWRVA